MNESERIARFYQGLETRVGNRWSLDNPGNRAIFTERKRMFRRLLDDAGWVPFADRRALEVGSGNGHELAWLVELGARPSHLVGVDLVENRIQSARSSYPEMVFRVGNAERLEDADETYDLVMAITVFSSLIERRMAQNVASEIVRVLKPGGGLLWYDLRYDSVANPNIKAVPRSRIGQLFPSLRGRLRTVTVLPPLARRLGPATPAVYPALALFPPLRSHLVGLLRKPGA